MKYAVIYTDSAGESHIKDMEFSFDSVNFAPPAPPVGLSDFMDVSKLVFFKIPAGWFGDWHPAPKKQFFCCLSGEVELIASDGEKRRCGAGDIFLLEDISGKGHTTRVVSNEAFVAAVVQLTVKT